MSLKVVVAMLVAAALASAWWLLQVLGMPASLAPEMLAEWLTSQGAVGPLLLILLMVIAVVVGPIPTLPVSATAGLAFGVAMGTAIAATGALTRLIPIFSFALISYAAGVTAIHTWRFALATLVGMLPMTMVFAGLGNTFTLHPALTVIAALVMLAVMVWLPWSVSRNPNSRLGRWLKLSKQDAAGPKV